MGSWRSVWLGAVCVLCAGVTVPGSAAAASGPVVYTGTGAQQVADALAGFQAAIGGSDNGTAQGPLVGGRRTLSWDDVGTQVFSAQRIVSRGSVQPSGLDGLNFFVASRRGLELGTAGTAVEVSSTGFRDLNPTYPALFVPPTGHNVFAPLGSTETDLTFEVPDAYTGPWDPGPPDAVRGDVPGSVAGRTTRRSGVRRCPG